MNKIAVITLSMLLAGCATDTYVTDITTESETEVYAHAKTQSAPAQTEMKETPAPVEQSISPTAAQTEAVETSAIEKSSTSNTVSLAPPVKSNKAPHTDSSFTLQIVSLLNNARLDEYLKNMPNREQLWVNDKMVNGKNWTSVLYGNFNTKAEAKAAIPYLPEAIRMQKPFPRSIKSIKQSQYPDIIKVN
ncbi:SPOR domain-containing protein [Aliivibrio kagoshimensis]|uniref:SPOR domain-containing protein n=1 Tax=Aliivibrio kagoshimensis TaxID=2910230 RepID=UPI003D147A9A